MIGYVTLGSNDRERANVFYDAVFSVIGVDRMMEEETFVAWGDGMSSPGLSICEPFDGNPASVGNGTMVALAVDSNEQVDLVYNKAIEMGGSDEGPTGERMPGFYAGYFRDLDGNKLSVFHYTV
jgi:uncharacterized glyoxalase superfamily protein PhnB